MWEIGFEPWVGKIPWQRAWQLTPVSLPGESPWTEEPGGLQSIRLQRVGHDWATNSFSLFLSAAAFNKGISLSWSQETPEAGRLTWDMWTTSNQRRMPGSLYAVTKEVLSIHIDCPIGGRQGQESNTLMKPEQQSWDLARPPGLLSTRNRNKRLQDPETHSHFTLKNPFPMWSLYFP